MRFLYYWDRLVLKFTKIFNIKDPLSDYKIYCYDEHDSKHSLVEILYKLEEKVKILEEENIETSNTLYELMNSIEAVDRRIDILVEHCRISEDV